MAICGVFALLLGYLAGLRFRVTIMLPLEVAAGAVATGLAFSGMVSTGAAGLGFLVFSLAAQVGYALALACPVPTRDTQRRPLKV